MKFIYKAINLLVIVLLLFTAACEETGPCGNGKIDQGEICDSNLLQGNTCDSLGFREGTLSCNNKCELNYNGCIGGKGIHGDFEIQFADYDMPKSVSSLIGHTKGYKEIFYSIPVYFGEAYWEFHNYLYIYYIESNENVFIGKIPEDDGQHYNFDKVHKESKWYFYQGLDEEMTDDESYLYYYDIEERKSNKISKTAGAKLVKGSFYDNKIIYYIDSQGFDNEQSIYKNGLSFYIYDMEEKRIVKAYEYLIKTDYFTMKFIPNTNYILFIDNDNSLYLINTIDDSFNKIDNLATSFGYTRISNNNKHLVYVRDSFTYETSLFIIDLETLEKTKIGSFDYSIFFEISPDSKKIAFSTGRQGSYKPDFLKYAHMYIYDIEQDNYHEIDIHSDSYVKWGPNSKTVAYITDVDDNDVGDLKVQNIETGETQIIDKTLINNTYLEGFEPQMVLDGKKLMYIDLERPDFIQKDKNEDTYLHGVKLAIWDFEKNEKHIIDDWIKPHQGIVLNEDNTKIAYVAYPKEIKKNIENNRAKWEYRTYNLLSEKSPITIERDSFKNIPNAFIIGNDYIFYSPAKDVTDVYMAPAL